jgi:hypothetical protein
VQNPKNLRKLQILLGTLTCKNTFKKIIAQKTKFICNIIVFIKQSFLQQFSRGMYHGAKPECIISSMFLLKSIAKN